MCEITLPTVDQLPFDIRYDAISLVFLLIFTARFFSKRRFPLLSNRLFALILVTGIFNLLTDIFGSVTLMGVTPETVWIPYVINALYYLSIIFLPTALSLYLLALVANKRDFRTRTYFFCAIPAAISAIVFLVGLPLGMIYVIHPGADTVYTYGALSKITYVNLAFYMLLSIFIMIVWKKYLTKSERLAEYYLIGFIAVAVAIQFFFPFLLLTGTAITASLMITYFVVQDPRLMLDPGTNLFSVELLVSYMQAKYRMHKHFHVVAFKLHGYHDYLALYGRDASLKIVATLGDAIISPEKKWESFRMAEALFVAILDDEKDIPELIEKIEKCRTTPVELGGALRIFPKISAVTILGAERFARPKITLRVVENAFAMRNVCQKRGTNFTLGAEDFTKLKREIDLENVLRERLPSAKGFSVHYQPIYSLSEGGFRSAEALLRFECPSLGRVSPGEFIPIIESRGLSIHLDEIVVERVFDAISGGLFKDAPFESVHINLSAASFASEQMTERILELSRRYSIDPGFVVFEITETAATLREDVLRVCAQKLRSWGFHLALDDFGSGYANIAGAVRLPFSYIKLDRTLILGSESFLIDVTRIFGDFPVKLIAEGVENEQQLAAVKAAGIDMIQGFYFARPMPGRDLAGFLAGQASEAKT